MATYIQRLMQSNIDVEQRRNNISGKVFENNKLKKNSSKSENREE